MPRLLTLEQGKKLVALARQSIDSAFSGKNISLNAYMKEFSEPSGAFVTLKKHGELRGCIGYTEPLHPLFKIIFEMARAAAFDDPRFPRLSESEFRDVEIEISVLTKPEKIKVASPQDYLKTIKIGRDGLIIRYRGRSGLLLPQVPVEWEWDVPTFLEHTCQKAGLPQDTWKQDGCELLSFQAQIFGEK